MDSFMSGVDMINLSSKDIIKVSSSDEVSCNTSSNGYIRKWIKDNKFIKYDALGYSDYVEYLVSRLLSFSNINPDLVLQYSLCNVQLDDKTFLDCSVSKNFLNDGESFVSCKKLLLSYGCPLSVGYEDLLFFMESIVKVSFREYLNTILNLDAIIFNDDRHFGNLGIIINNITGQVRLAPIFDNGAGLLSDTFMYPMSTLVQSNLKGVYAKPFYTDFGRQVHMENCLKIDINSFFSSINPETKYEERAIEVLRIGLNLWEGKAWIPF